MVVGQHHHNLVFITFYIELFSSEQTRTFEDSWSGYTFLTAGLQLVELDNLLLSSPADFC